MDIFRENGAQPIWLDAQKSVNRYICFQTELDITTQAQVSFYICTDTKYELYINGALAGFGQYEDFPCEKVYDEYDVSSFVKQGKNLISLLAYSQGEDSFQHISGLPMVIFAAVSDGKSLLVSDDKVKCREASEFKQGDFERITPQRSFNFAFDLRADDGWREKNVSAAWENAVTLDDSAISYLPRPNKKLELSEVCCGKVISQGSFSVSRGEGVSEQMQYASMAFREKNEVLEEDGSAIKVLKENTYWISDLGKETAGYITLDIDAQEGAILDIACGEHLADLRVRSFVGGRNYSFRCVCRGGRQKISFYVRRLAGRYLQFFAHGGINAVYTAGLHKVEYPLDFIGKLHTNDRLFNKIYDISMETLKLCMHEHYEDCPQREQALYGMDSRNQMLTGYYSFGETTMPRASLELLGKSQKEDGTLEICAPAVFERSILSFTLMWVCALQEYVLFSGDLEFAGKMRSIARKVLDFFMSYKANGLVMRPKGAQHWNFYEWTDGMDNFLSDDPNVTADAPLNSFCILALNAYSRICEWLDEKEEQDWANKESDEIKAVFHKTFYCEEKGVYQTYVGNNITPKFAQLTQALALLTDCVPEEFCKNIRAALLSDELVETSLSYLVFKYDALMQEPEKYGDYILDDIERQWGYMLYNGATSFWETILGEADFDNAGSLCHGWSAVPIYVFWRYVMGIYPQKIGFADFECAPLCGKSIEAEGILKTPNGLYTVSKKQNRIEVKAE